MALSGSFNSPVYGTNLQLQCTWSGVQNVEGNYTDISVVCKLQYYQIDVGARTGTIQVGDSSANVAVSAIEDYSAGQKQVTIMTRSNVRVYHDEDGTKSVYLFARYPYNGTYSGQSVTNIDASGTFTLDPIDRYPDAPSAVSISAGHGQKVGIGDTVNCSWSGAGGVITGYEVQCKRGAGAWADIGSVSSSDTSGALNYILSGNGITDNGSGLTVQMRVRALNGALTSDWAYSNYLTIEGLMKLKVGGQWKDGSTWIKINGNWVRAKRVWVKVGGVWQEI